MILLTGATGTIGSSVVKALTAKGVPFKVGTRSPEKTTGLQTVAFDWDKPETFGPALAGVDKVFLLQPSSPLQHGWTLQLIAAAKRAGVKHLVKLSVIGADSEPGIALGRQHLAAEKDLRQSGIAWTFLRPTYFMQNFVNFYGADPEKDAPVYLPHGDAKVAWVDARDIAEAAAAVLTTPGHEGKVYDLTGPTALTTAEALEVLGGALGRKYSYVNVTPEAANKGMAEYGAPPWLVDGFAELAWVIRQGWAGQTAPGVKDATGKEPRSFQQYAKDFAATVK